MAEAVIDPREPVEVEEENSRVGSRPIGPDDRLGEAVEEQRPVGKAGQGVVESLVGDGLLGAAMEVERRLELVHERPLGFEAQSGLPEARAEAVEKVGEEDRDD